MTPELLALASAAIVGLLGLAAGLAGGFLACLTMLGYFDGA